jgi:hypothetical protein
LRANVAERRMLDIGPTVTCAFETLGFAVETASAFAAAVNIKQVKWTESSGTRNQKEESIPKATERTSVLVVECGERY